MKTLGSLIIVVALAAGCDYTDVETANSGTFEIQAWTEDAQCDGSAVPFVDEFDGAPTHGFISINNVSFLGTDFIEVFSCSDFEDCQPKKDFEFNGTTKIYDVLTDGDDAGGFTGFFDLVSSSGNECSVEREDRFLDFVGDDIVTFTRELTAELDYVASSDCFEEIPRAIEEMPCVNRVQITATRVFE